MINNMWVKSSKSMGTGDCVQVRATASEVHSHLGDTSPVLRFTPQAWAAFTASLTAGDFEADRTEDQP